MNNNMQKKEIMIDNSSQNKIVVIRKRIKGSEYSTVVKKWHDELENESNKIFIQYFEYDMNNNSKNKDTFFYLVKRYLNNIFFH